MTITSYVVLRWRAAGVRAEGLFPVAGEPPPLLSLHVPWNLTFYSGRGLGSVSISSALETLVPMGSGRMGGGLRISVGTGSEPSMAELTSTTCEQIWRERTICP